MAAEVFAGDVGTIFRVTITDENNAVVDCSTTTTKQIWFKKPTGEVVKKTATFTTSGTDGQIEYAAIAGDLVPAGVWELEGYVVFTTGSWHSTRVQFPVRETL